MKVGDTAKMSKYKNNFAKGYVPNWSQKFFLINEVKNTVLWKYVISDLNGKEFVRTFYEKELQKTNPREFRAENYKLHVKWKGHNNSFNHWIDKIEIV